MVVAAAKPTNSLEALLKPVLDAGIVMGRNIPLEQIFPWLQKKNIKDRLNQMFINKGLVKTESSTGVVKFKPTIARINRAPYGWHIILALFPGLSLDDLLRCQSAIEYAVAGECQLYQDASNWVHLKVYTKHMPLAFKYAHRLTQRVKKFTLAIPVGISRQGFVMLRLSRDEEFGLLVAGMPGWGKSVFLRQALTAAVTNYTPRQLELFLIDMKLGVEFSPFHDVPHTRAWAGDLPGARKVLVAVIKELNWRARLIEKAHVTNITEFNALNPQGRLPHVILAIDEFADLGKEEKEMVTEICRKGRFAGIHPIICTQRPTTDVLPGATKALLPCVLCFRTSNRANSRYVLGEEISAAAYIKEKGRAILLRGWPREVQVMNLEQVAARQMIRAKYEKTKKEEGMANVDKQVVP